MRRFVFVLILGAAGLTGPAAHAACSWTTLTNGTTANADQVMGNFDCLAPLANPSFTGNVGIGVTSPGYKLQVNTGTNQNLAILGHLNVSDGVTVQSVNDAYSALQKLELRASQFAFSDGNVGIGVTNPGYRLQVNAGTNQNLAVLGHLNVSDGVTVQSVNDAYSALQKLEFRASQFAFSDGNIGIGVVNPGYRLQVNAGTNRNLAVLGPVNLSSGITVQSVNDAYTALQPIEHRASMHVFSDGYVGIGTANPNQALDVVGTIRQSNCTMAGTLAVNGNGDIICSSDARLKNLRGSYTGGLDVLGHIVPQRFTYKSFSPNAAETFEHVGFIAQNVKTVLPQAVAMQRDGHYSLEITAILAAAVNAIKELKAANDNQAAEILSLKRQMTALSRRQLRQTASR